MPIRRWDKSKPPTGPFTLNRDCPQARGLVAWYPMGGASGGGKLYDRLGTNHHVETAITRSLDDAGAPVTVFNGSTSLIETTVVPVYAAPLSIGIWFYKNVAAADTTNYSLCAFGNVAGTAPDPRRFQMDTYNGDLRWLAVANSVGVASKSGIVAKKWHHALGIEISSTSRYVALDGALSTQNITSATPSGTQNRFSLGFIWDNSIYSGPLSGMMGEVCVWSNSQYDNAARISSPATRYELWYPLRSRKWISVGATLPTLSAAFGRKAKSIGLGVM